MCKETWSNPIALASLLPCRGYFILAVIARSVNQSILKDV